MSEYIPSPRGWVAEQVELYEGSGGTDGLTLRDTGLPVIIVTNRGRRRVCRSGDSRWRGGGCSFLGTQRRPKLTNGRGEFTSQFIPGLHENEPSAGCICCPNDRFKLVGWNIQSDEFNCNPQVSEANQSRGQVGPRRSRRFRQR